MHPVADARRRGEASIAKSWRKSAIERPPHPTLSPQAGRGSAGTAVPSRISGAVPPQSLIFAELLWCLDPGRGSQLHGDASPPRDVDRPTAA